MKKFIFLVTITLTSFVYGQGPDETYIFQVGGFLNCYLKITTVKPANQFNIGEYQFWVYTYPDPDHIEEFRKKEYARTKNAKYYNYSMSKAQYYINCNKDKIALYRSIDYSSNGEVIVDNTDTPNYINYQEIVPDTDMEYLVNFVCDYIEKSGK